MPFKLEHNIYLISKAPPASMIEKNSMLEHTCIWNFLFITWFIWHCV